MKTVRRIKRVVKPKTKKKEVVHYVDNKRFFEAMKEFAELRKPYVEQLKSNRRATIPDLPPVPDEIGLMITQIAHKLSNSPGFANYPFKDDMIADGIENCLLYIDNFDPEKSNNPFAYFTQIITWAFVRRIKKEKQHLYIKYKSIENGLRDAEGTEGIEGNLRYGSEYADINMRKYIEQFETNNFAKKEKSKQKMNKLIE